MNRKKGFDLGARFGRVKPKPRGGDGPDGDPDPPVTLYCPFRCPRCGNRYPRKSGTGRGPFPLHYLVCKGCALEYRAQEVDAATFQRFAGDTTPETD